MMSSCLLKFIHSNSLWPMLRMSLSSIWYLFLLKFFHEIFIFIWILSFLENGPPVRNTPQNRNFVFSVTLTIKSKKGKVFCGLSFFLVQTLWFVALCWYNPCLMQGSLKISSLTGMSGFVPVLCLWLTSLRTGRHTNGEWLHLPRKHLEMSGL